jgi:nicotinamidase-related amidase
VPDRRSRTAILAVDMVRDMFAREELGRQRSSIVEAINRLIDSARRAGDHVVWIRQEHAPDLSDAPLEFRRRDSHIAIAGTPGAELLPELDISPRDHVVIKKRYSGFFETDLDEYLRRAQITKLVVGGVMTHACIRMTAIDAYQRDYDVVIVRDCVGSWDQEHHEVSLRYMDGKIGRVVSLEEFLAKRS